MAELLGHLMGNWPNWAVVVGVIFISVIGIAGALAFNGSGDDAIGSIIKKRRRNGKAKTK